MHHSHFMEAIILVKVSSSFQGNVEKVLQIKGVKKVYELTGDIDLLVEVEAPSETDLKRIVDEILNVKGVESTDTRIVLSHIVK
ncbi:MAG: Lrp/AsnC ligand binding domain-containing protein [Thermoproteota archaeon]